MGKLNKYQEAITIIQLEILDQYLLDEEKFNQCTKDMKPYFDTIQELIDKETPMRLSGDSYNKKCNICGNGNLNTKYTYGNYCSGCGQKIDWSDEE